jgi:hypothetical protein
MTWPKFRDPPAAEESMQQGSIANHLGICSSLLNMSARVSAVPIFSHGSQSPEMPRLAEKTLHMQ